MNNDDTRKESAKPAQGAEGGPLIAFYDAITNLQIECAQLVTATRLRDCEDVRTAAEDAVALYLVATASLRRSESQAIAGVFVAAFVLTAARKTLDALFTRASERISDPSLHKLLGQLRVSLVIANGELPPNDRSSR